MPNGEGPAANDHRKHDVSFKDAPEKDIFLLALPEWV